MVEVFQGQPCRRIRIACGDTVLVALQGAHVLSWVSGGRERLFLSPANHWDGRTAIRGGIPVAACRAMVLRAICHGRLRSPRSKPSMPNSIALWPLTTIPGLSGTKHSKPNCASL